MVRQLSIEDLPARIDPRLYAFGKFAPTNPEHGWKLATASIKAKLNKGDVTVSVPDHAALCLNIAHAAYEAAAIIPIEEIFKTASHPTGDALSLMFDYFEQVFINIVFAYTALEAFSNQTIPDDFVFSRLRDDKKCNETFNKDQIERNLSLDIKLSEVLPEIAGTKFQKGSSLWNDYSSLRKIRDRIIHVKSADLGLGLAEPKVTNIWADLLTHRKVDFSMIAHKVIKHFPIKREPSSSPVAAGRNMWINHFPIMGKPKPSVMNKINDRTFVSSHSLLLRMEEVALELTLGASPFRVSLSLESSDDGVVKWDLSSEARSVALKIYNTNKGHSAVSEKNIPIFRSNAGDVLYGQFAVQHFTGDLSSLIVQFTLLSNKPINGEPTGAGQLATMLADKEHANVQPARQPPKDDSPSGQNG